MFYLIIICIDFFSHMLPICTYMYISVKETTKQL